MKYIFTVLLLCSGNLLRSQVIEDFSDGNYTATPIWRGSNNGNDFLVVDNKLRSNSNVPNSGFYLSTENTMCLNVQWEFWVNLQMNTSGSNYADIYVISDKSDLKSTLINGYFIRIGNTEDEISLYRRSGSTSSSVKIIDGINGSVGSTNTIVKLRLKRDILGNFTLEREVATNNTSYFLEGTVNDLAHTTSTHFGISIQQSTASFFFKHFFDDFKIGSIVTDTIPPVVEDVSILDSNTIVITFNKEMDSLSTRTASNYSVSTNAGPIFRAFTTNDPAKIHLRLVNSLNSGTFMVTVSNVKDKHGNIIRTNNTRAFNYVKPYKPKFGDVIINEIFADPTPQIDLPSVEFVELRNNTVYPISLKNWKFSDSGSSATFGEIIISPQSFLIICAKADTTEFRIFGKVLGLSPWPTLNNSGELIRLVNAEGLAVDSIRYSDLWYRSTTKKQGGWSLERKDPGPKCLGHLNWFASRDITGGTPGKENSIYVPGNDIAKLTADSIKHLSDTTIKIYFNKHLDSSTILAQNFLLNPRTSTIKKILADYDVKELELTFDRKFLTDTKYLLLVENVKDCQGVIITNGPEELSFKTSKPPSVVNRVDTAHLIITEIFADPSPEVHLPLVEFIEVYNPSKDSVNLSGWSINDPTTKGIIQSRSILPQELIILCAAADTNSYKSFGKTIGITPWPSLNNSSDQIVLKSFKNRLVDSVAYSDTWYRSNAKKPGGWSLERIDLSSVCEPSFNWTASIDTNGGTPGKANSVHISGYDLVGLKGDSLKLLSDSTIKIYFNKHLNSATLKAENFELNPVNTAKKINIGVGFRDVTITYENKFQPGTAYSLIVSNINDCSGKPLAASQQFQFKTKQSPPPLPERIDTARIIITEIFADPSPEVHLPLAEFIEIYNPSNDTIDLNKWTVNDPTTKATISNQKILPREFIILCPVADTISYKAFGKTIGINPWPALNNSSDQIVIRSFKNRVVDSVGYSDTWYHSNVKKPGGWSLEKIELSSLCEPLFNWTASIDTNGGTPGKTNSVHMLHNNLVQLKADSLKLESDSSVRIYFNKHLYNANLASDNFNLTPANTVKKITSNLLLREVILIFEKKVKEGTDYKLLISGIKDCNEKPIISSQLLEFKTKQAPPPLPERIDTARIIITEIFADPSPEVGLPLVEYIELYNPGLEPADLSNWVLGDASTRTVITDLFIKPGEYLILVPREDTVLFVQFGKTKGISPWPSLGNAGDIITLKSFKKRIVDSVAFTDKWYKSSRKKNGGWSLEKADITNKSCNGFYNWHSSIDSNGGTPGRANSITRLESNIQPIRIDSLSYTSDSTVTLHLNSIPDTMFLKPAHFKIDNNIGKALTLSVDESYKKIRLEFHTKFLEGIHYILSADSLYNCLSESTKNSHNQVPFIIKKEPELDYPILINEIFADPLPQIGLPEAEFVELYNSSERPVNLKGMLFADESFQFKFTSGEIAAQSYLILCQEKEISNFSTYGKVLGLPVWPSLGNERDILLLKNNKGRELQRVAYNNSWYREKEKKAGGYSLEMISPISSCTGSQNWSASKDPKGGTPGKQNSIFNNSPGDPLKLLEVVLKDSVTLLLTFNKSLDSLSASASGSYYINNGIGTPDQALPISPVFDHVELKLKNPPTRGLINRIELKQISDCSGSLLDKDYNYGEFLLTERIQKNSILVNEILFNPRPNGVDFIELFNNTKHVLDLQDLSIATIGKDTIEVSIPISRKQFLFEPGQYIALTSAPEILKKEYIIENPDRILKAELPLFKDQRGTVALISNGTRIDELHFDEKMHFQLLKKFDGISLERSSVVLKTNESGNFRSATAASGFATPGYRNSQYSDGQINNEEFRLISRTFSPDNDGFEDLLQVSYRMPAPGMVANVKIFNDQGVFIKHLLKNSTLNLYGLFVWDGLNEHGSAAEIGIYFIFAEIFDIQGKVRRFRRPFVLAYKL
ncbi:MAG: lamin tail domain-containing protein [Bacteroidota bacterium]